MNVLDKLLGLSLSEDLTETTWWTDTIFRGLEENWPIQEATDSKVDDASTRESSELT
jgi:hypothetical protein